MFTGIVEDLATVKAIENAGDHARLTIASPVVVTDRTEVGESIAVNGVCLTVVAADADAHTFGADVMHETLNRSSLGALKAGSHVDVERAMRADGRFSGHVVAGHIDGTGVVESIEPDGIAKVFAIRAPRGLMRLIAEKGSITVDGISLTVTFVRDDAPAKGDGASAGNGDAKKGGIFGVAIIPHTLEHTVLGERRPGDVVNLEVDMLARYVERLLDTRG